MACADWKVISQKSTLKLFKYILQYGKLELLAVAEWVVWLKVTLC